jgi:hypothetical protein
MEKLDNKIDSDIFKCKIPNCGKSITQDRMRLHIGKHYVKKELVEHENLCGFYGLVTGCSIELKKTSGFGTSKTLGPYSNCLFFYKFSLKSASSISKRSPCTNIPMICIVIIYFTIYN